MKKLLFVIVITLTGFYLSSYRKLSLQKGDFRKSDTIQAVDTVLIGDINSDAIKDTAFVFSPKMINAQQDYEGDCLNTDCTVKIVFSGKLGAITIQNAIGSGIESIGDVNKDGYAEVIVYPYWFIGCWGKVHFYTFEKKTWRHFGFGRTNICDDSIYAEKVKIISTNKIKFLEHIPNKDYSDMIQKYKVIKLK